MYKDELTVKIAKYKIIILLSVLLVLTFVTQQEYISQSNIQEPTNQNSSTEIFQYTDTSSSIPTTVPTSTPRVPKSYSIPLQHHTYQTFNNCGPASLSMALSYYNISISQHVLGKDLRPYQNTQGNNDDKSVTLEELARKAEEFGLISYHRPLGNFQLLKRFIANDIPVITRTWTAPDEDIGHFRLVRGFTENEIIQDDSLQGKNLTYTINEFNEIWKQFNYEYLVLIPPEKIGIAQKILGENIDEKTAWKNTVHYAENELIKNPQNIYARFNLSVALYNTGLYQKSIEEYEKVANLLPSRTLWYQIEPIQAYYETGNYNKVFEITNEVLNNQNKAYSELYILRGNIYKKQGNDEAARNEYEKAVFYNTNHKEAKDALNSLE